MTTTTKKVFYGDDDTPLIDEHALRKAELRDLKLLQKQEQKQIREMHEKVREKGGRGGLGPGGRVGVIGGVCTLTVQGSVLSGDGWCIGLSVIAINNTSINNNINTSNH